MNGEARKLRMRIGRWTNRTQAHVLQAVTDFLPVDLKAEAHNLETIVDELVKNAIKANYKYLILQNRIYTLLRNDFAEEAASRRLAEVCRDMLTFDDFIREHAHLLVGLLPELIRVITEEHRYMQALNKKHEEKEPLQPSELRLLEEKPEYLTRYRLFPELEKYVELRVSGDDASCWMEIINSAPMLRFDFERIQDKRAAFDSYLKSGTENEYMVSAYDDSEGGAGLGYATLDTRLYRMGLEPRDAVRLISFHSTNAMVHLDFRKMRAHPSSGAN